MSTRDTRLPFTVLLPDEPGSPTEIHDHSVALHMVIVDKDRVHTLDASWEKAGVYMLLDVPAGDGSYGVYVGKAPAGLRSRLMDHERKKQWSRALLVQRDTQHGLNSAHVGWLEGDLWQLFNAAAKASLHNGVKPGDDTVPSYELRILESYRDPIVRVLRFLGYDTTSPDDTLVPAVTTSRAKPARHAGSVADLLAAGLLSVGADLTSTNSAAPGQATVNADGTIRCLGVDHGTPSAAASAVRGGAANGWDFWAVQTADGSIRLS